MLSNNASEMNDYFSAMSGGKPLKTYKKTILGRVYVTVLNMMTGTPSPEGVHLEGDPRKNDPNSMFDVWTQQEDAFFRKMNRRHLEQGIIIEITRKETPRERTIEEFSDNELKEIVMKPFKALEAALNKTQSVATLYRILGIAQELEKSDKVIRHIESRLSEVQEASNPKMPTEIEENL